MDSELQMRYDSLCYATMLNVRTKTSGAERIVLRNFDYKNKEHKFVLAVVMACWNILGGREVAVDAPAFTRASINRRYKKTCKVKAAKDTEDVFVDVVDMLEFMRGSACALCGEDFTFGQIYDTYYERIVGYDI